MRQKTGGGTACRPNKYRHNMSAATEGRTEETNGINKKRTVSERARSKKPEKGMTDNLMLSESKTHKRASDVFWETPGGKGDSPSDPANYGGRDETWSALRKLRRGSGQHRGKGPSVHMGYVVLRSR